MREQDQFLDVTDRDDADRRWRDAIKPTRLGGERIDVSNALGRVLHADVYSPIDVPGFDRSNVDGFALRAADTFRAAEETPLSFSLNDEDLLTGVVPRIAVVSGTATPIATGGMLPRGADAVAMIEFTTIRDSQLIVRKAVSPSSGVTFAGTDIARGELVLRAMTRLTSRETGVLSAMGLREIDVIRLPRVAILSTGDEIVAPGLPLPLGSIYDANATILADAVRESGGVPTILGIVKDDEAELEQRIREAVASFDVVLLSGGTSKGGGDVSYRVLSRQMPGIIVHGVSLKPGKPVCLGASGTTPVAILPGFPTSAVFTFHEFVAPVLQLMAGLSAEEADGSIGTMATRVNSERGRTEYLLVNLVGGPAGLSAYPMGKGSGSVTAFGRADGFVTIPQRQEFVAAGESVWVSPLGRGTAPADLIAIGSHCIGLDCVLGFAAARGFRTKTISVGSEAGLLAAARGECDLAGVHLLDPSTGIYNQGFLPPGVRLLPGYRRMQGVVFRGSDERFRDLDQLQTALDDPTVRMVNRNRGSGTRVLIDELLKGRQPEGFAVETRSHNAVCAAIDQGRADWGIAIEPVSRQYGLGFIPLRAEHYDLAIPESRWDRPAVACFRELLIDAKVRASLVALGFLLNGPP